MNSSADPNDNAAPDDIAPETVTPFDAALINKPAPAEPAVSSPPPISADEHEAMERAELRRLQRDGAKIIGKSRGTKILLGVAIVCAGLIGAAQYKSRKEQEWRWAAIPMPERIARVPEEWGVHELAERLAKSGKVRHLGTFIEAASQTDLRRVKAGAYPLPARATPLDLARIFKQPPPLVKVTFPEGFTCRQIARRLESRGFTNAIQLLQMAYPPANDVSPSEGRWFPDTYWLPVQGSASDLAGRLNARFTEVMHLLPKPLPLGAKNQRLTQGQVLILASLVERETSVPDERPLIAGVLLNRLQKGMRLQCDATVQYARILASARGQLPQGHKARLNFADTRIDSLYNTYKINGLPPAPICNPGQAAIFAAARPKTSPYFFYVMSPKMGRHRFAKTFAEHQHNVALYRQERKDQQ